jgi:serine/threonine protein phosphatase 1
MRYYAIGDIHGQYEMLLGAHLRIMEDRAHTGDDDAPVVHLGDLCDRGPDTRSVLDHLISGIDRDEPWIVLKGNHDAIFHDVVQRAREPHTPVRHWASDNMGGRATMASYGVEPAFLSSDARLRAALQSAVPEAHVAFLEALPLYHEAGPLLFVHAGIRPGLPLSDQIEEDLTWIRRGFLEDTRDHGWLVVHGHTPVDAPMHCGNRVNLDTGAGFGNPLTVAVFEGKDCWILTETGREPLNPPQ